MAIRQDLWECPKGCPLVRSKAKLSEAKISAIDIESLLFNGIILSRSLLDDAVILCFSRFVLRFHGSILRPGGEPFEFDRVGRAQSRFIFGSFFAGEES